MSERIVVLGGTFDPVHVGHIAVIEQARDMLAARAVLMVANQQWLRDSDSAPAVLRLEMARAGFQGRNVEVSDLEIRRGGPSYTVDTMVEVEQLHPDVEVSFVLGADAARTIGQWHRAPELLNSARFVIVNRTGIERVDVDEARALGFSPERTRLLAVHSPDVSATEIRRRVAAAEPYDHLVPPGIAAIIARERLFGFRGQVAMP